MSAAPFRCLAAKPGHTPALFEEMQTRTFTPGQLAFAASLTTTWVWSRPLLVRNTLPFAGV